MAKVAVVYQSSNGNTAALAREVARGVELGGARSSLIEIRGADVREGRWDEPTILAELEAADGIIFGSPTYMGSVSAVMKAFLERAFHPWLTQRWKDKVAGGFTNSASQSGDKLATLMQLHVFAAQMGMIWVGVGDPPNNNWSGGTRDDLNRLGSWVGVMSQSHADETSDTNPSKGDRLTGRRYGKRVALLTRRFIGELADGEYTRAPIAEDEFRLQPDKFKAEVDV